MKKISGIIMSFVVVYTMAIIPISAAEPIIGNYYTVEYDLAELMACNDISALAAESTSTKSCPQIKASSTSIGPVSAKGIPFTLSIPSSAKIKNVQIYQDNKSNSSIAPGSVVNTFQIIHKGITANVDYRVIDKPTLAYPCNTTVFNGLSADGEWQIGASGKVISLATTTIGGFTINGAKLIVTYSV